MPVHIAAELVQQFYDWERRGRGWLKLDFVVDLEPPYEPFWGHFLESGAIIDDGKRPSFLSLFSQPPAPQQHPSGPPEVSAYAYTDSAPLSLFLVQLPRGMTGGARRMEELLVMLSYRTHPMSFELIGTAEAIVIQVSCRETDARYVQEQCAAFFPECGLVEPDEDLLVEIMDTECVLSVADFGLCDEFMLPLATASTHADSYTPLFGILHHLVDDEAVMLQVLFNGTVNPWGPSIMAAVCDDSDRQSFFVDAPDMPALARQKLQAPLCAASVRLVTRGQTGLESGSLMERASTAVVHASRSVHNRLFPLGDEAYTVRERLFDIGLRRSHRVGMLLNTGELANLAHFPTIDSRMLYRHARKTRAAAGDLADSAYILGFNSHHGTDVPVGLPMEARLRHMHLLGATGTGKSTLLHGLIVQDIQAGVGCCVLDPHGDLIDAVLSHVPERRIADVVLIDPTDATHAVPFNILAARTELEKELLASDLVGLFRRFTTSFGDQMHSVLANALLALLYNARAWHLGDLKRFLIEPSYRKHVLATVTDADVAYYWQHEFPLLKGGSIGSLITRLDSFLRPKPIRHMLCQEQSLDLAQCMDSGKVILVKLPQGIIGEENSYLLGALIIARLQQCAMARQAQAAADRTPFFIYIDEFHHFITSSMASILSDTRKYGVGLVLAHQAMQQVTDVDGGIANAIMTNAYTRICFRVSDTDAKRMQDNFASFAAMDFQQLQVGEAIARVGAITDDFSLTVRPYAGEVPPHCEEAIRQHSRHAYAVPIKTTQGEPVLPPSSAMPVQQVQEPLQAAGVPQINQPPAENIREHRYLQTFIKKMAQECGFIATIEYPLPHGAGFIDVVLEKDSQRIAVEISVSTDVAWELHNIEKCLNAGFSNIVVCSSDATKLKNIHRTIQKAFSPEAAATIQALQPKDLSSVLVRQQTSEATTVMKGYRVKVQYDATGGNKEQLIRSIFSNTEHKKP